MTSSVQITQVDPKSTKPENLVLIHGLGGDRNSWLPIAQTLSARYNVWLAELPGFGSSPALPANVEPDPQALAKAIGERMVELGISPAHVCGVSLGGWVSLLLGINGHAKTVTALAPAGFWKRPLQVDKGPQRKIGRIILPALKLAMLVPALRELLLRSAVGHPRRIDPRTASKLVDAYLKSPDFVRVDAAMRSRVFEHRSELGEAAKRTPIQVIWGGLDPLVKPPREPLPESVTQHLLKEAGHLPHFDDPEMVCELIDHISMLAEELV